MTDPVEMPLFPLRTVLFPGGQLPLRIFEPRYLDLVRTSLRDSRSFGVVLIRSGSEAHLAPDTGQPDIFDVGTEARIIDFNQLGDGLLGIVAEGGRKLRVRDTRVQRDHLLLADVSLLPEEPRAGVSAADEELVGILRELIQHPMIQKLGVKVDFDDARSVSWRLAELLPIEPEIKQSLLQLQSPRERLAELGRLVTKLRG